MADISIVSGTIAEFIDGALTIVMLMIFYYIVRIFMVAPPTKAEREAKRKELEEQRAKWGEWVGGKWKEHQHKQKKEQRKGDVSVVKDNIKDALEGMDNVISSLNKAMKKADLEKAKKAVHKVKGNLHHAVGNLRLLRRKHAGEDGEKIQEIITNVHTVERELIDKVEKDFPTEVDSDHKNYLASVVKYIDAINLLRGNLGNIWNELDDFHEKFEETTK